MSVYDDIQTAAVIRILISSIEKQEKARGTQGAPRRGRRADGACRW